MPPLPLNAVLRRRERGHRADSEADEDRVRIVFLGLVSALNIGHDNEAVSSPLVPSRDVAIVAS